MSEDRMSKDRINAWVRDLLIQYVQSQHDDPGHQVDAISAIVWLAIDQGIEPETLHEQGQQTALDLFASLCEIEGFECADIATDADKADTVIGKRWRSIRHQATRKLL